MNSRQTSPPVAVALVSEPLGPGRLGSYAFMGAVVGAVPLPWVPGSLSSRVRGALVHDVATRHGLSLTPDARRALVCENALFGARGLVGSALNFAVSRVLARLGPLTLLPPVRSAVTTFALGHLLDRYMQNARSSPSVRVDDVEAKAVRRAIDRAVILAFSTPARGEQLASGDAEELRDELTQLSDGALAVIAGLPGWVVRRLDAAFDAALAERV